MSGWNVPLLKKNTATSIVSHLKMTRQAFVKKVLHCLLQNNDVPFHRDVVFDGALNTRCRWCWRVQ